MATWQELARRSIEVANAANNNATTSKTNTNTTKAKTTTTTPTTGGTTSSSLTALLKDPVVAKDVLKMADPAAYGRLEGKEKRMNLLQGLGEVFSVDEWTDDVVRALQSWYDPTTGKPTPFKGALKTIGLPLDYVVSGVRKVAGGAIGNKDVSRYDSPRGKDLIPQMIATGRSVFDAKDFQREAAVEGKAQDYLGVEEDMSGVAKFASGALGMALDTVATPSFWLSGSASAAGKLAGKGTKTITQGLKEAGVGSMQKLAAKSMDEATGLVTKALTASGLEISPESIAGVMKSSTFIKETLQKTLPKGLYKVGPLSKGASMLKEGAVADTVARYIDNPLFAALGDVWGKVKGVKVLDEATIGSTMDDMVNGIKEKLSEGHAIKKYGGDVTKYHLDSLSNQLNAANYTSKARQNAIAYHMLKIKESGNTDYINQAENWIKTREYWTGASDAGNLEAVAKKAIENPKQRKVFWDSLEKGQGVPTFKKVVEEAPIDDEGAGLTEKVLTEESKAYEASKTDLLKRIDETGARVKYREMDETQGVQLSEEELDSFFKSDKFDWEAFSRKRGYPEEDIANLKEYHRLTEEAQSKFGVPLDVLQGRLHLEELGRVPREEWVSPRYYDDWQEFSSSMVEQERLLKTPLGDWTDKELADELLYSDPAAVWEDGERLRKVFQETQKRGMSLKLDKQMENIIESANPKWARTATEVSQARALSEILNDKVNAGQLAKEMEDLDLEGTLLESGFSKGDLDLIGQKEALDTLKTRHYLPRTQKFIDDYVRKNPKSLQASMFKGEGAKDLDRTYAHALATNEGELFKKLPEDLRNIWASQSAKDPEVGGLIKVGQEGDMHGSHWFNAQMEYDHLNDTLLDKVGKAKPVKQVVEANPMVEEYERLVKEGDVKKLEDFLIGDDEGYQVQGNALKEWADQTAKAGEDAAKVQPELGALNRAIDMEFDTIESLERRYGALKNALREEGVTDNFVTRAKKEINSIQNQIKEAEENLKVFTEKRSELSKVTSRYEQLAQKLTEKQAKFEKYRNAKISRRKELLLASKQSYVYKPYKEDLFQLGRPNGKYKDKDFDTFTILKENGFSTEAAIKAMEDPTGYEKFLHDTSEVEFYKSYAGTIRNWARKVKAREMALKGEVGEITYNTAKETTKEGDVLIKTPNNLDILTTDAMFKVSDDEVEQLAQRMFEKDFPGAKISEVESGRLDIVGDIKKSVEDTAPMIREQERLLFREQNFGYLSEELQERYGYLNVDGSDFEEIRGELRKNIKDLTRKLEAGKKGLNVGQFVESATDELKAAGFPKEIYKSKGIVYERAMEMMNEVKGVEDSLDMELMEKIVHEQNLLEVHELTKSQGYNEASFLYGGQKPLAGPLLGSKKEGFDEDFGLTDNERLLKTPQVKRIDKDIQWVTENDILKKLGQRPSNKLSSSFEEIPILKTGTPTPWEQYLAQAKNRYIKGAEETAARTVKSDVISEALGTTNIKGVDERVKFVKEAEGTMAKAVRGSVVDTGGVLTESEEKTGMFLAVMKPKITGETRIADIDPIQLDNILTTAGFKGPGKNRIMSFVYGYKEELARQESAFNNEIVPWIERTLLPDTEKQDIITRLKGLKNSSLLDMSVKENRKKVLNDVLALERRFEKLANVGDSRDQMASQTMLNVFLRPMKEHADNYLAREKAGLENIGLLGVGHRSMDVPEQIGKGTGNIITEAKRKYATQAIVEGYNAMGVTNPLKMKTDVESIVKDVVGYQIKEEGELLAFHENMGNLLADLKAGKGGEGIRIAEEGEVLDPRTWFEVTVPGLKGQGVYVTKELKGEFDVLAKFWKKDEAKGFMKYVRFVNNLWKGVQTGTGVDTPKISGKLYEEAKKIGMQDFVDFYNEQAAFVPLSPAFTFRNTIGNLTAAVLKGEIPIKEIPKRISEAVEIQKAIMISEGATEFNQGLLGVLKSKIPKEQLDDLVEEVQKSGLLTETQVGNELIQNPEVQNKFLGKVTEALTENRAMMYNNNQELIWKIAIFRNARQSGKSVADAVKTVNQALFDYSALTPFEQEYIRPYTVFYTWTKKNVELMADLMTNEPQKFKAYAKLLMEAPSQLSNSTEEEKSRLPKWTEGVLGIPMTIGGETRFISGFGGNLESFMEVLGANGKTFGEQVKGGALNAVDMLAPTFKLPFNLAVTGQNTFKGMPISEDTSAYGYRALPSFMKKALGISEKQWVDKNGNTGTTYRMDGEKKYAIESSLGRASTVPLKVLSMFSGEDKPTAGLLDLALGLKTTRYDTAYLKYKTDKEKTDALMKELERLGLLTQYTGYGYNSAGAQMNQPLADEYLKSLQTQ